MSFEFRFGTQEPNEESRRLDEYQRRLYDKYTSERDNLNKTALEIGGRYDKAVFVLGGGALGLSITFIEKIAPHPTVLGLIFLCISWILLLTSLVLLLFATSNSQNAIQLQIVILDATYAPLLAGSTERSSLAADVSDNSYRASSKWQDRWCRITLVLGLICLCLFAVVNVSLVDHASETIHSNAQSKDAARKRAAITGAQTSGGYLPSTNQLIASPATNTSAPNPNSSRASGSPIKTQ